MGGRYVFWEYHNEKRTLKDEIRDAEAHHARTKKFLERMKELGEILEEIQKLGGSYNPRRYYSEFYTPYNEILDN